MTRQNAWSDRQLADVIFVSEVLSPFFLEDPKTGGAGAAFMAVAQMEVATAAAEWPFSDSLVTARAMALMQVGLPGDEGGLAPADGEPVLGEGEELAREYRRLFVGPQALPAPPWGSVYTDKEGVIFGEGNLALRRWMREHGFKRQNDEKVPDDHLGLLLALMATVARHRPEDLDGLLAEHILPWSSHYLDQLEEAAEHPFYQGLAQLTRATLEGIQRERALKVDYPTYYR